MKDKSETYIIDDFQYDIKKMIEKIKEADTAWVTHTKTTRMRCFGCNGGGGDINESGL